MPSALLLWSGLFVHFLYILNRMMSESCEYVASSVQSLINWIFGPLCFTPNAEKIGARLKHKLALIMLSNELNFCSINLISPPPQNPINMRKQGSS